MQQTAAQRTFALPEILQAIFHYILYDISGNDRGEDHARPCEQDGRSGRLHDPSIDFPVANCEQDDLAALARCARVCTAWFIEALPILWTHRSELPKWPTRSGMEEMQDIFNEIEPFRRQMYADHLQRGVIWFGESRSSRGFDEDVLANLTFPRLQGLKIFIFDTMALPKFAAPNLTWIELDPHYEACYPEIWGADPKVYTPLFEAIIERFPLMAEIEFCDQTLIYYGSLALLKSKRPDIKIHGENLTKQIQC